MSKEWFENKKSAPVHFFTSWCWVILHFSILWFTSPRFQRFVWFRSALTWGYHQVYANWFIDMFLCQIKLRVILEEGFARTYIRLKPWPSGAGQNKLGSKLWINFYEVRDRLNQRLSEKKTKMFDSRCLPQTQALRCFAAFEDCQCGLMSAFLMLCCNLAIETPNISLGLTLQPYPYSCSCYLSAHH